MGYSRGGSLLPSSYADVRTVLMPSLFQRPAITPDIAFTVISLFAVIGGPFFMIPMGLSAFAQVSVAWERYNKFFGEPQLPRQDRGPNRRLEEGERIKIKDGQCVVCCVLYPEVPPSSASPLPLPLPPPPPPHAFCTRISR